MAIKRYVISFWNGIDLRYKLLKDPGVKISIAGIIISRVIKFPALPGWSIKSYLLTNRSSDDDVEIPVIFL